MKMTGFNKREPVFLLTIQMLKMKIRLTLYGSYRRTSESELSPAP